VGVYVRTGFCPTKIRRVFFVLVGFCPGGLLSGGDFVQRGFCPGLVYCMALHCIEL